jgi:hypothetical protein
MASAPHFAPQVRRILRRFQPDQNSPAGEASDILLFRQVGSMPHLAAALTLRALIHPHR